MTTTVLDASAVVALAHGEPGADAVAPLVNGAALSSVNWSEVARVCISLGRSATALHRTLTDAGCVTVAFSVDDANVAADLWSVTREAGLSLGDRACIALARRLGAEVVTADRAWATLDLGVPVLCIR